MGVCVCMHMRVHVHVCVRVHADVHLIYIIFYKFLLVCIHVLCVYIYRFFVSNVLLLSYASDKHK